MGVLPRRLCTVCFRAALPDDGCCATCGAPMLPLDDRDALAELRRHARERAEQRRDRLVALLCAVAAVAGVGLAGAVARLLPSWGGDGSSLLALAFALFAGLFWMASRWVSTAWPARRRFDVESADASQLLVYLQIPSP